MIDREQLNTQILNAHAAGDVEKLSHLYRFAGDAALQAGNIDHGCFYLTHAYVFALEGGLDAAEDIHAILKKYGREE